MSFPPPETQTPRPTPGRFPFHAMKREHASSGGPHMNRFLYLAAIAAGAFSTALSGSDATMAKDLAQPVTVGLLVRVTTILALVAAGAFYGGMRLPEPGKPAALPWWAWLGRLGDASVPLAQPPIARKIGAAPFLAITVTAGIVVSVAMDHFGWLGFERNPARLTRLVGGAVMVVGVVMVTRS